MAERGSPEDLQRAIVEAHALLDQLFNLLEGRDQSIGLSALFAALREVGMQTDQPTRVLVVRDLRELANEMELIDAARH